MKPSLGSIDIDLPRLLETRMLIQANSGAGKSHALRRVLEQTAPLVQQLVIDPEGEFQTLRERFDYIVCAPSGADAVATPKTAAALAVALWRSGSSAVIDIYELQKHERILFVRRFLEALTAAPKSAWHSTIIALDEIQDYCPETGSSESSGAVVDVAARGRKRGLCLLGATQRIARLSKDCAAELLNKAIGRTGMDVDVRRAMAELGMSNYREALETLRNLDAGEFFVFGPALSRSVERTKFGPVVTTHPEIGQKALSAPPPASVKVKAQLAKIEGLQRDAETEVRTVEGLTAEVTKLRRALTVAEKPRQGPAVDQAAVSQLIDQHVAEALKRERAISKRELEKATVPLAKVRDIVMAALGEGFIAMTREATVAPTASLRSPRPIPPHRVTNGSGAAPKAPPRETASITGLRAGAVRILQELAARSPAGYTLAQVGGLTQFSVKGGTFRTYLGDLRRGGFIEERGNLVFASEHGITSLGDRVPEAPTTHDAAMALWRRALRAGAHLMLERVVAAGADGIDTEALADSVDMQSSGGTFRTYLGDLRRNGLIATHDGRAVANDILWPERA